MSKTYSKTTRGFNSTANDNVEITDEYHQELLDLQTNGKEIVPDENGYPIAIVPTLTNIQVSQSERYKRDSLLRESDHTQLDDSPRDKVTWKLYRKDLRDIPDQPGFPNTIIWPIEPE